VPGLYVRRAYEVLAVAAVSGQIAGLIGTREEESPKIPIKRYRFSPITRQRLLSIGKSFYYMRLWNYFF
jgi:hypothetical protein